MLFFAISGYCLYHSDFKFRDFGKWYIKRIRRIYVTVVIIVFLTCLFTGAFPNTALGWIQLFIYPTEYHFVASIMILYIVYYIWMHFLRQWKIKIWVSGVVFSGVVFAVYFLTFDKSWYHIDVVEEHFIRFLFFGAMLIGAHIKEKEEMRNSLQENSRGATWKAGGVCIVSIMLYFIVRLAVPRYELYSVQFITWIAILLALYYIFRWAQKLEWCLTRLSQGIVRVLSFIASITLQIYLVQWPIIEKFEGMIFPLNLFVIIILILVAATVVYWIDKEIQRGIDYLLSQKQSK